MESLNQPATNMSLDIRFIENRIHSEDQHGFQVSMSGKGNCYDNSAVETFFKRSGQS